MVLIVCRTKSVQYVYSCRKGLCFKDRPHIGKKLILIRVSISHLIFHLYRYRVCSLKNYSPYCDTAVNYHNTLIIHVTIMNICTWDNRSVMYFHVYEVNK